MTTKIAHEFVATLKATPGSAVAFAPPRVPLAVGAPPEFGGTDDVWSPEHLLLSAVSSCFWTTFRALAMRKGLPIESFSCMASGTVEKGPRGLEFSRIQLTVDVAIAHDDGLAEAHRLLERAKGLCLVTQSLRVPVTIESQVQLGARAAQSHL